MLIRWSWNNISINKTRDETFIWMETDISGELPFGRDPLTDLYMRRHSYWNVAGKQVLTRSMTNAPDPLQRNRSGAFRY